MIIECPACQTKYNQDLPPEGRMVRCARCRNVWRAMPVMEEDQPHESADEPAADDSLAGGQAASWGHYSEAAEADRQAPGGWESAGAEGREEGEETAGIEAGPGEFAASGSEEEPSQERDTGKVRWLGGFLRKNGVKAEPKAAGAFEAPDTQPLGETIPFPSRDFDPESPAASHGNFGTLDDARAAVRNVFASLERPNASASFNQAPVAAGPEEPRDQHSAMYEHAFSAAAEAHFRDAEQSQSDEAGWQGEAEADAQSASLLEQEGFAAGVWRNAAGREEEGPQEQEPQNWLKAWQRELPPDQEDPDAQLRNAMRAYFPPRTGPVQPTQGDLEGEAEAAQPVAEALTAFWQRPLAERTVGEAALQPEEGDADEAASSFDERLYREIEETREHAKQPRLPGRKGGLALAAAWGLFLSVAGGLTAGLFAFRDIAADALPGLAPFYQALGMPVTVQPLVFEGAQYDWSLTDNKPVLHIKGSVYNRAQRNVNVPDLVITVKDDDPALDREIPAALPVDGPRIGPGQNTDFEVELISPSPSINAVELELRNVR